MFGLLDLILGRRNPPAPVDTDRVFTVSVGGRERTALVHFPVGKTGPFPLVLNFHGGLGNATQHRQMTGMNAVADKYGFIVAYPNGTGSNDRLTWNAGSCCGQAKLQNVDDVAFVDLMRNRLVQEYHVDVKRIYACGFSNGAMLCHLLGRDLHDKIAAIGTVSGTYPLSEKYPTTPVPCIHLHGLRDENSPFNGGIGRDQLQPNEHRDVMDSMDCWVMAGGVRAIPTWHSVNADRFRLDYDVDEDGTTPLQLHVYPSGGHVWQPDASELLWQFFSRHELSEVQA